MVRGWRLGPRYRDRKTERFARGDFVPQFDPIRMKVYEKLELIESATRLIDLRNPPSNHFEKLSGDRSGQFSIRINRQWRICFEWSDEHMAAFNIEIVDYH